MQTRVVRFGNSRGIRIPKVLLEQTGLPEEFEISAVGDSLVIRPAHKPRSGWAAAFKDMASAVTITSSMRTLNRFRIGTRTSGNGDQPLR